jgi:2C-methyl-D-erythritol 2,4-cyclodiphosphate synthase
VVGMTFYDPKAVEYDLELISSLTSGKRNLTNQMAQKIYYKIKAENIKFKSDTGEQFLSRLLNLMTDEQVENIDNNIAHKRDKMRSRRKNGQKIIMINGRISAVMTVLVLCFIAVATNWEKLSTWHPGEKIVTSARQTIEYVSDVKNYSDKALADYNEKEQQEEETKARIEEAKKEKALENEVILRESEIEESAVEEETVDITALSDIEDFELDEDGATLYKYTGDSVLVDIPKTVTTIEKDAFDNLESVRGIMLPLSIEKVEEGAFSGLHDGMIIYVYDAGTTNTINCAKELANEYEQLVYGEHLDIETVESIIGIDYGVDTQLAISEE